MRLQCPVCYLHWHLLYSVKNTCCCNTITTFINIHHVKTTRTHYMNYLWYTVSFVWVDGLCFSTLCLVILTIYPMKYTRGFVVICFVSFILFVLEYIYQCPSRLRYWHISVIHWGLYLSLPVNRPWQQGSWGQHGAHLGPTGPRCAPCWPHEPCYLGMHTRW